MFLLSSIFICNKGNQSTYWMKIYKFVKVKILFSYFTSSIGEKIKKSSEISECFKIMGSQLSFFPYAISGSMHEVGEFYNQPPSNLHTSLRGGTRGYKRGRKSFQSVLNLRIPSSRRLT